MTAARIGLAALMLVLPACAPAMAQPAGKTQATIAVHGLASDGVIIPSTPVPTATPTPAVEPTPIVLAPTYTPIPRSGFAGEITHYGESFNGQQMACGGTYWSSDSSIAAVPYPSRNREWPCGTEFVVSGPAGSVRVVRTDSCPGCHHTQLDLSESGMMAVCGYLGRCPVWIEVR